MWHWLESGWSRNHAIRALMAKKVAIVLALLMLAVVIWGLFFEAGATRIIIDGHELTGPLKGSIGAAGFIVGMIALFCAAIFLLFVFAGIGIYILACIVFAGLIAAGFRISVSAGPW